MAIVSTKPRTRSPRYPSHSLEDAIGYARKIYDGVHRSSVDSDTAFRLMGFAGKSGASATALGSVRQYGLIEGVGEKTKISNLALQIMEPESIDEHRRAILQASLEPDVFQSVLARFDGKIPSVDEPVRAFLIRELEFSKNGADECIASLRRTIAYSRAYEAEPTSLEITEPQEEVREAIGIAGARGDAVARSGTVNVSEMIRVRLSKDCIAEIRFEGQPDGKALANLIRHVELMKEVWAED